MIYRSEAWLNAVRPLPNCVLCGSPAVQAAHANIAKGMSIKADDAAVAALCPVHHHAIDHGKKYSRPERKTLLDRAIVIHTVEIARRALTVAPSVNPQGPN